MKQRGTPRLFSRFLGAFKSRGIKSEAEGHRAFFCRFCGAVKSGVTKHQKWRRGTPGFFFAVFVAHSKAVSLCIKNEAE